MTVTTAPAIACSCGDEFPDAFAAGKHRDQIKPLGERRTHVLTHLDKPGGNGTTQRPAAETPPRWVVIWEEPPPVLRGSSLSKKLGAELLAELKLQVGRWAKVATYPTKSSASTAANSVNSKKTLGAGWEAAGRRTPTGSALYLRWVGPK